MLSIKNHKNSIFNLLALLLPTICVAVSYPVILKTVGDDVFGMYALGQSIASSLLFLDFGTTILLVKKVANSISENSLEDLQSAANIAKLVILISAVVAMGSIVAVIATNVGNNTNDEQKYLGRLLCALSFVQVWVTFSLNVICCFFKAQSKYDEIAKMQTALSFINTVIFSMLLIMLNGSIVYSFAACQVFNISVLIIACGRLKRIYKTDIFEGVINIGSIKTLARFFKDSFSVGVQGVVGILFSQGQKVLIGFVAGPGSVAIYHVGYTLISKGHAIVNAIVEVVYPIVCRGSIGLTIASLYKRYLLASVVLSVTFYGVLALFGVELFYAWVGRTMSTDIKPIILPLCIAFLFMSISTPGFYFLTASYGNRINLQYALFSITMYLLLMLIMYGIGLGLIGVTWVYAVTSIICGVWFQVAVWKKICYQK